MTVKVSGSLYSTFTLRQLFKRQVENTSTVISGAKERQLAHRQCRFCLVGEDDLVIKCASFLKKNTFAISAIFSDYPAVIKWGQENNINIYTSDCIDQLNTLIGEFDYLLSISNPKILSDIAITAPQISAVNYHNALLPNYAGTNATAWAILNGEKTHGISWHIMTHKVDQGDVLFQASLPILKKDTAISLNIRCHQLAEKTFSRFLRKLFDKKYKIKNATKACVKFYKSTYKPKYNGFIHWEMPVEEIDRTFRALNFENYSNTIATPRFIYNHRVFIIRGIRVFRKTLDLPPGHVISLKEGLHISALTANIHLKISFFNGLELSSQIMHRLIKVGDNISIDTQQFLGWALASKQYAQQESFWVSQWEAFSHITILSQSICKSIRKLDNPNENHIDKAEKLSLNKDCFCEVICKSSFSTNLLLLSLIAIYLYRQNQYNGISFLLHYNILKDLVQIDADYDDHSSILYDEYLPLNIALQPNFTLEDVARLILTELERLSRHGLYLKDIFCRFPSIKNKKFSTTACVEYLEEINSERSSIASFSNSIINFSLSKNEDFIAISSAIDDSLCGMDYSMLIKNHLDAMICGVQQHSHLPLSRLPMIKEEEKAKILYQWSNKENHNVYDQSLITLFEEQVNKYPLKIAVVDINGNKCNYTQLNEQSDSLANYLNNYQILPQSGIGLMMDDEIICIVVILAILKLRCYYIPIPKGYSNHLIRNIMQKNSATLLLVNHVSKMHQLNEMVFFSLDITVINTEDLILSHNAVFTKKREFSVKDMAYVMYTSGSTGRPKGVIVNQNSIIRLVKCSNFIDIKPTDNIGQSSSIAFDASTFLIWGALLNGATLTLLDKETLIDNEKLLLSLRGHKISILWLTARLFDSLSERVPYLFNTLNTLIIGGDTLNVKNINRVNLYLKDTCCVLLNGYGPTENTTFTTVYKINKNVVYSHHVPIGKPVTNTTGYVLDKFNNMLPIGMMGELHIGGQGLTRGYLNAPQLDHEKFIDDFHTNEGYKLGRLYRSNDLVYWTSEGNLEHVGRIDNQVKIRGYRVDLNMIADRVLKYSAVQDVYVMVNTICTGEKQICAFITTKGNSNHQTTKKELLQYLEEYLPIFMLPQHIFIVKQMPLNQNGKIDFRDLMAAEEKNQTTGFYTKLGTITDIVTRELMLIWYETLGHSNFNIDDSFFDLGGTSLNITPILLGIERKFSIAISVTDFLNHATIKLLSSFLHKKKLQCLAHIKHPDSDNTALIRDDLNINIQLPKQIDRIVDSQNSSILLTGVTGFLGQYLLRMLLAHTDQTIYCLVRNKKYNSCKKLLKEIFLDVAIEPNYYQRVKVILGDLKQERLGMTYKQFDLMSQIVGHIYHVGACVNHIYDYASLRCANVLSTKELVKLSTTNCLKKILYVSSLSGAVPNKIGFIEEAPPKIEDIYRIPDAYSQTKCISEYLLYAAKKSGIDVKVVRPGWILGDEVTGISPSDNHLICLIQSCIETGVAPNWESELRFLPVDFMASAILKIANDKTETTFYNLTNINSISWRDLIKWLNNNGYDITLVSVKKWLQDYLPCLSKNNPLTPFVPLYLNNKYKRAIAPDLNHVNQENTLHVLKEDRINYPNIDDTLLKKYFC